MVSIAEYVRLFTNQVRRQHFFAGESLIFFQVKHQRAFHRLLLSLAIMDNLYLVSYNLILRMEFHFHFWEDCLCPHLLPCQPESQL